MSAPYLSSDGLWFGKDMSQTEPIPDAAISRVMELMQSGKLHRYGEQGSDIPEASLLERDFATYLGTRYCVAVSSGGSAMFLALKALGVKAGDDVLTSSFTLAPVPGAIEHVGARPVLVATSPDLTTNLDDLEQKMRSSKAKVFLLSHMRGHITDMEEVTRLCDIHGVTLVEDCAHTMGASWAGRLTGTWGQISCFSTQTYKHINSGEGGLVVTDDDDLAAKVILMSGCYMMYGQHLCKPPLDVFERWKYITPNFSLRMSNLAAALLRPQIELIPQRAARWRHIYDILEFELSRTPGVSVPKRHPKEEFVPSSIQFSLDLTPLQIDQFVVECQRRGLYVKWFGCPEPKAFTSNYSHWRYFDADMKSEQSMDIMRQLLDLRLPISLSQSDCKLIGRIIAAALNGANTQGSVPSSGLSA